MAAATAGMLGMLAGPASAYAYNGDATVERPGYVRATYYDGNKYNYSNRFTFYITDTACDSHSVYILYRLRAADGSWNSPQNRINWNGGCNTTGAYRVTPDPTRGLIFYACADVQRGTDQCSGDGWTYA